MSAHGELHSRQQARHGPVGFVEADTLVVAGLYQLGPIEQRGLLHLLRRHADHRFVEGLRCCQLVRCSRRQIHERRKLWFGLRQLVANGFELQQQLQ